MIAALVMQWHILCGGFMHQAFAGHGFHAIRCLSCRPRGLRGGGGADHLGALLGSGDAAAPGGGFLRDRLCDQREYPPAASGSSTSHALGAYFGLAASKLITPKHAMEDSNNAANYHSDMFAMIGTTFSGFTGHPSSRSFAGEHDREMAAISTLLPPRLAASRLRLLAPLPRAPVLHGRRAKRDARGRCCHRHDRQHGRAIARDRHRDRRRQRHPQRSA